MNIVYYIVKDLNQKDEPYVTGGHGYSFDPEVIGKKKLQKGVPTAYGYYVEAEHQNIAINQVDIYNGRVCNQKTLADAFLLHVKMIINKWIEIEGGKLLLITGLPKMTKSFSLGKVLKDCDENLFNEVYSLYDKYKDNIIIDYNIYPKGGIGVRLAYDQSNIAKILSQIEKPELCFLDVMDEKSFREPESGFNNLVCASRWYFNTGDASTYYNKSSNGRRVYHFGRVEPDKSYYGKATPEATYSILFTKEPIRLLDKLYEYCKVNKDNPFNLLLAGNLLNIKSKEVARTIDTIPGSFEGNRLIAPSKIRLSDDPSLVELLNPPGLSYRITDALNDLEHLYEDFINRDKETNTIKQLKFMDITDLFFIKEKNKLKLNPNFNNTVLTLPIKIDSPKCPNPVTINLSVSLDCPSRNSFNSLIKDKVEDVKVWLGLSFVNAAGVNYFTIVETPEFDYILTNSIANLKVYSLKELGKK